MRNKNITAIILAGGKSRRMGRDKAFIKIGGKTFIERIIEMLKPLFREIIIVTNEPEKFKGLDVRIVRDIKPNCGPLSGIHSGLVYSKTELNFVVACDMPFLDCESIEFMCSKVNGYGGVLPKVKDRIEPLYAIYSKSLIPLLEEELKGDDFTLHKILKRANILFLDLQIKIRNINDKEELKNAKAKGEYLTVKRKFRKTILACGGQLKNTYCVASGNSIFLSPTFGDLDKLENYQAFENSIKRYLKSNSIKPQIVAYDLHPEYLSTKFAQSLKITNKIGVQHHHAHMCSALFEDDGDEMAVGVTFDGTGYGLDGNIWGGEFLIGKGRDFKRAAHLKYVQMPGGEQAIKEPWRMAASWLYQIYGEDFVDLRVDFARRLDRDKWAILKKMIQKNINSPLTSSIGRLFDAVSSLLGVRQTVEYEAQAAIELERIADLKVEDKYDFKILKQEGHFILDPTPIFVDMIKDLRKKVSSALISARFHNAIAQIIVDVSSRLRDEFGVEKVILSGGVFLNKYLTAKVKPLLAKKDFKLCQNQKVSVGDSGISIGQVLIANEKIR